MAKISIDLKKGGIVRESNAIIGIDLGTTNSLVAYIAHDGKAVAVKDADGKSPLVPSVVHFAATGGAVLVGEAAKEKLVTDPERTIFSVKRLMGKSYQDVAAVEGYFGYQIIDDADAERLVKIRVGDRFYTPIELSSQILLSLKARIEAVLNANVRKAVITVPAYFNDAQRQATRDAGKLAGLDVLRILNEPTAASLAYGIGLRADECKKVAVYDLGGGTFDISVLQIENGIFEVLSTNGDTFLGGDDFDRAILQHWLENRRDALPADVLKTDKSFAQSLRLAAEATKKALSTAFEHSERVGDYTFTLDRMTFERLMEPLVQRTLDCCRRALQDAKCATAQIDQVVMVGGATRVPLVKAAVGDFFGQKVFDDLNPDEVVAIGAAIQADILAGNNRDLLLLDITPLSLGIETVGGLMDVIIPRNAKVPARTARQYTTSVDGQRNLKVAVYQGERDLVQHNRKLGEFILRGIPPMPMGLPKIEITFILDADGILKVRARELRSGVEQTVDIRAAYGLSEEEMAQMLLDSLQNAQTDMEVRALLEARNEADNVAKSARKFLAQNESLLADGETQTIQRLTDALEAAMPRTDKDAIHAAMEALNQFTAPIAHRVMDANIAQAMKGKTIG